jgi:hypothetical protein
MLARPAITDLPFRQASNVLLVYLKSFHQIQYQHESSTLLPALEHQKESISLYSSFYCEFVCLTKRNHSSFTCVILEIPF